MISREMNRKKGSDKIISISNIVRLVKRKSDIRNIKRFSLDNERKNECNMLSKSLHRFKRTFTDIVAIVKINRSHSVFATQLH